MKGYLTQLCIEIVNGNAHSLKYRRLLDITGMPEGLSKEEAFSTAIYLLYFAHSGIIPLLRKRRNRRLLATTKLSNNPSPGL